METHYTISYLPEYFDDLKAHQKSGQKVILRKIAGLLLEIAKTPKTGTGKPEELKGYKDQSVWSRRIDKKHRLVYEILEDQNTVKILSAWGHYE